MNRLNYEPENLEIFIAGLLYVTTPKAAEIIGCEEKQVESLFSELKIPNMRVGLLSVFKKEDVILVSEYFQQMNELNMQKRQLVASFQEKAQQHLKKENNNESF